MRIAVGLAGGVVALWLAFAWLVGPALVRVAYGTEATWLDAILSGRDVHPVERYLATWRDVAASVTSILVPAAAAVVVLAHPAVESFLARRFGRPDALDVRRHFSAGRLLLVHAVLLVLAGGSVLAVAVNDEWWPFSNYTMYSNLAREDYVTVQLYGVTADAEDGGEFPLDASHYVRPFDRVRLTTALRTISRDERFTEADRQAALSYILGRYEALRREGIHDGPPICGLRLYELHWRVTRSTPEAESGQRQPEERRLLWERSECGGHGTEAAG